MPERSAPVSRSSDRAAAALHVVARAEGGARLFELSSGSLDKRYRLPDSGQQSYLDFLFQAAGDFGLRPPLNRTAFDARPADPALKPLLTWPVSPMILYGYGDP